MFASLCLLFCLSYFVDVHATDNLVPFIDKCEWTDEACLVKSTQKAIPYFGKGLPELGVPSMDPLKLKKANLGEAGLKVVFTDMDVVGVRKCNILKVVRDIKKNKLGVVATCPFDVSGEYDASGELLFTPVEGKGAFRVDCQLIHIEVDLDLTTVVSPDSVKYWKIGKATHSYEAKERCTFDFKNLFNGDKTKELIHIEVDLDLTTVVSPDSVKYWKIGKATHSYEAKERCTFDFKNLFNGDKTKAEPILNIYKESWKELMHTVAKPIVDQVIDDIVNHVQVFFSKVPAEQLEKQ